jgi:hypothetical protein
MREPWKIPHEFSDSTRPAGSVRDRGKNRRVARRLRVVVRHNGRTMPAGRIR